MAIKDSHLTLTQDALDRNLSVPVRFLDTQEDCWISDTDTLNIDCEYATNGEQLNEWGANIIIEVSDSSKGWEERLAFAISADFDWN